MRLRSFVLVVYFVGSATASCLAHGPQIQITATDDKIVTRRLLSDAPYVDVTAPTSVYVMPVLPFNNVWYSRPNKAVDALTLAPSFPSGPGLAYGSDLADGGPQAFAAGSILSLQFLDGLKRWNGTSFVDAGAAQLKAFRGSNESITSPAENFAVTSDVDPFDGLSLAAIAAGYGAEGAEVHSGLRFALMGDGSSPTSASPDGVYLATLQISSTQSGLTPSDDFFFVLHKNAGAADIADAVHRLGVAGELVQFVPEPSSCELFLSALVPLFAAMSPRRSGRP